MRSYFKRQAREYKKHGKRQSIKISYPKMLDQFTHDSNFKVLVDQIPRISLDSDVENNKPN